MADPLYHIDLQNPYGDISAAQTERDAPIARQLIPEIETSLIRSRSFLVNPLPDGVTVRCSIRRSRNPCSMTPDTIIMVDEDTNEFLLSAAKYSRMIGSSFSISISYNALGAKSKDMIGSMNANKRERRFEYIPADGQNATVNLQYEGEINMFGPPRKFSVNLLPFGSRDSTAKVEQVPPKYTNGRYILDFKGRVKLSSIKNFILRSAESHKTCLLFGKVENDRFAADISAPLSVAEGFALCCASINNGSFQR